MPAAMRHRIPLIALLVAALAATAAVADDDDGRDDRDRRPTFDLQAHRGGLALRPENTLPAFANAMRVGVSTLELDIQITEDGQAVVTHDRQVTGVKCRDTAPATPGDPEFPYVGKYVNTLTLAQVKTLDCGTRRPADPRTDPYLPTLVMKPGERMPTLEQVLELVKRRGDRSSRSSCRTSSRWAGRGRRPGSAASTSTTSAAIPSPPSPRSVPTPSRPSTATRRGAPSTGPTIARSPTATWSSAPTAPAWR